MDFRNFLAGHHEDLDVPAAARIFAEHDCAEKAHELFEIANAPKLALAYATQP